MITIQISGLNELYAGLDSLEKFIPEYEDFVKNDMMESLYEQTLKTFANQQNPYSQAWIPLSPYTLKRKKTNRIMYETGALMRSLNVDKNDISLSFNIAYALKHQTGETRLPQRLLLPAEEKGLPKTWSEIIESQTNLFLANYL